MTSGSPEQRRFPRREARASLSGTLTLSGRPYSAVLVDHSFDGLAVRVPKSFVSRMEKDGKEIELLFDKQQITGEVAHSRVDPSEGAVIGISLGGRGGDGSPSFATHDPGWDLIENPETLNNIFTDLAYKGPEAPLHVHTLGGDFTFSVTEVLEDKIVAELSPPSKRLVPQGRGSFRFEIFQTSHSFESTIRSVKGATIEIDRPKQVARLLRRETFRVRNGSNNVHVRVRCLGFFLGAKSYEFDAFDLSEHGVGIADREGMLSFPRGFVIEQMEIEASSGAKISAKGTVRASRWDSAANAFIVGLHIETKSDAERTAWHNTILSARYPSLSFQYQPADHAEIWNLFERSGYISLNAGGDFTHVVDVTRKTWQILSDAGTRWSKRAIIRKDGLVVGHMQMDRVFPKTFCVHHLAIDPKISKIVGKEIYAVATDVLLAEEAKYVYSITQASKPWNQRSYYDFVADYRFPEHNEMKTFSLYEIEPSKANRLESFPDVKIGPASDNDLRRVARYFEVTSSEMEIDACALTYEELRLHSMGSSLRSLNMDRGREFIVAHVNNQFAGFARLEYGTPGVNVWGLLDTLYVYTLSSDDAQAKRVHETLFKAGIDRYREMERRGVIALMDDGRSKYYSEKGLNYCWEGVRWIGLRDILPRYHAYTQMLYGHLILRRETIRKRRVDV